MRITADSKLIDYRLAWTQGRQEIQRQRLVRVIFLIYWLLIFEGALRKWGFPSLRDVFFFVRVPVTLVLYGLAFSSGRWSTSSWPMVIAYSLTVVGTALIPVQMVAGGYDLRYLLIAGYGWVNYFFYIPLAFIIAEQFRAEDLHKLIRLTCWIAIIAAPLVILQFYSSPNAVVNQGSGLDEATQFKNIGAYLGRVRPNGFFTSTEGQAAFVASATAFVMFGWLGLVGQRPMSRLLTVMTTLSVLVMVTLSQSRGLFFIVVLIFLAAMLAGFLTHNVGIISRSTIGPVALVGIVTIGWPLLFPEAFEAFSTRWIASQASESGTFQGGVFGRAFYGFYEIIYYMEDTPVLGYLIGLGGNATNQIGWARLPDAAYNWSGYGGWAEGGWARNVIELGPGFGLCFIAYRIALTVWLAKLAVTSARRSGNTLPLLIFSICGIGVLNGQITGNGTINGYTWMFVGLLMVAARTAVGRPATPTARA